MKKASVSIASLLLFAAAGFSQNIIKNYMTRPDHPVSGRLEAENFISGFRIVDNTERLIEINQEIILRPGDPFCFQKKILKNKK